jgi:signal transduction histidine kinase
MAAITFHTPTWGRRIGQAIKGVDRTYELELRASKLEQYLATQNVITKIIARATTLEIALPHILQAICETTGWEFGEVWHLDPRTGHLTCKTTWCDPASQFPAFENSGWDVTFAPGKGLPGRVWKSGTPAWITNVTTDANFLRALLAERDGLRAGMGVPIRIEGEIIGAMTFFCRQQRQPDRELLRMLETVGSQIGLFIEREQAIQLEREQAQKLVAFEERQRLARDLHDSVTQTLFSASVIAEMLPILWSREPEQVEANLSELQTLTRCALTEMRDLLVELRPPAIVNGDLAELLHQLAEAMTKRTKIQVALDVRICGTLPEDEKIALYRITQETLNNIVKHATATHVSVRLFADAAHIELCIEDNGCGFDPACIPAAHFGVQGMRERAEGIGATLQLDSAPGAGTRVCVVRL